MLTDIILTSSLAVIVFICLATASGWLASNPLYSVWLILGMFFMNASNIPVILNYGISLYLEDLFFLILGISCLIRFSFYVNPRTVPRAWWIIGIVQFILFVWGFRIFGTAAGVDYRGHFYLWVSVVYFSSIRWTETMINDMINTWVVCSLGICLLVYYRWIGSAVDPAYAQEISALDPTGVRFRVVGSGAALVMAIGFLILFFKMVNGKLSWPQRCLLPLFFVTIVVLQHRSVWVSLLVGFMCLVWTLPLKKTRLRTTIGIALMIVPLAISLSIQGKGNDVIESVAGSASRAVSTQEGTMVSRVGNWQDLLSKWANSHDVVTYLVGKPYGSGYNPIDSEDGNITVDMVPHNHLVHILYRGGLISLCATLSIFYQLLWSGIVSLKSRDKRFAPYFIAVFGALFAYYIPYWATYFDGILLGIAISYFAISRTRKAVSYSLATLK
jgi:hypothetical protein